MTAKPVDENHVTKAATDDMQADESGTIECGQDAARYFAFGDGFRNLNHGSFGTYPTPIRAVLRHYQDAAEARPDAFIRYEYTKLLDASRAAIAKYVHAPPSTCVFVPNATTGINIVLRNLVYAPGDVIVCFATIYGACEKTVEYIAETTPAESHKIEYRYPVSDEHLCSAFERAVTTIRAQGKTPRLAVFDTIVSLPGVRMPFERLTALCKRHRVLSCIDGAHGVGHVPLDLAALDPDFFVSNCHKWLLVPRGCALFYVPERNQHLMRSTLPTSHGFAPWPKEGAQAINNPLPPSGKSDFVTNFEFVGTVDNSRSGEEAVMAYTRYLSREVGRRVAGALGTEVMENAEATLGECNLSNVRLPLSYAEVAGGDHGEAIKIAQWIAKVFVEEYNTFMAIIFYDEAWWIRLSSQVYLTVDDFDWGAKVLREVCDRVAKGHWR